MDNNYKDKVEDLCNTLILIKTMQNRITKLDNENDAQIKCKLCEQYIKILGDYYIKRINLLKEGFKTLYREAKTDYASGDRLADMVEELLDIVNYDDKLQ